MMIKNNIVADKNFWYLFGAIGASFSHVIFSILLTDLEFIHPPTSNVIIATMIVPIVFLLIPTVIVFVIFKFIESLKLGNTHIYFRDLVLAAAIVAVFMRYYYIYTDNKYELVHYLVLFGLMSFLIARILEKYLLKLFIGLAFFSTASAAYFIYESYITYNRDVIIAKLEKGAGIDSGDALTVLDNEKIKIPVVHVIMDELSAYFLRDQNNEINARLYPNFADFAKTATWYPNYTTGESSTIINLYSMVSGIDLLSKTVGTKLPKEIPTIYSELAKRVPVVISEPRGNIVRVSGLLQANPQLSYSWPSYIRNLLNIYSEGVIPQAWIEVTPLVFLAEVASGGRMSSKRGRETVVEAYSVRLSRFIDQLNANSVSVFYSYFPHSPYMLNPDGSLTQIAGKTRLSRRFHVLDKDNNSETYRNVWRSYKNQIRYVDNIFGKIIGAIKKNGDFEDALIIVGSDHGIGFTSGATGRDNHKAREDKKMQESNVMNAAALLMVKYPRQADREIKVIDARPYDIAATVADVLGVKANWKIDGISLRSDPFPERKRYFRPTFWKQGYGERVSLPKPYDYQMDLAPSSDIASPFLGEKIQVLDVVSETGGALLSIARECALPDDQAGDYVLTLDGYSILRQKEAINDITLIAVNDVIVRAVSPTQYYGITRQLSEKGLYNTKWTVELPADDLRSGTNSIAAFAAYDKNGTKWARHRGAIELTLSDAEYRQLSTRSRKQDCVDLD